MALPPIKTTIEGHTVLVEKVSDEDGEYWLACVFNDAKFGMPIVCQGNTYKEALGRLEGRLNGITVQNSVAKT